jgi:hypothetical protein
MQHIQSFPRVESHYCRARTSKEYLEDGLNLSRMYELFLQQRQRAAKDDTVNVGTFKEPVSKAMYSHIFNTEFNIAFHVPKSDRCDICETYAKSVTKTDEENSANALHVNRKQKEERDKDRQIKDPKHAVLCVDLQNVITLPRSNVSSMFYKRKLAVYNMTGHLSLDRKGYCVIWNEVCAGRTGNDMASAIYCMLTEVMKLHPDVDKLTVWSDSCVPQNKNSIMSTAIVHFLLHHENVTAVTQKFGESGHSSIQEVDNIHSQIEKKFRVSEINSPIGLLKTMKTVNIKNPFVIIQQRSFYDFQATAKKTNIDSIPFTQVSLCYSY